MKCRKCGKETVASLCNLCFLEEVTEAVEMGEDDFSKILRGMANKFGRLRHLKRLPAWKAIFTPRRIRKVITHAETGERCKLVPSMDGLVAIAERTLSEPGEPFRGEQSAEGGRIITYYEGDVKIGERTTSTSLVYPHKKSKRMKGRKGSEPPHFGYRSPQAYPRPESPLD